MFVADDTLSEEASFNIMFSSLWRSPAEAAIPNDGLISSETRFPEPGSVWVLKWTCPAHSISGSGDDGSDRDVLVQMEPGGAGFHTTDSIDVDVLLEGELTLELDDGVERQLLQGDLVVVNGTRHRWHNRSPIPAEVLTVVLGARRVGG